MYYFIVNPNSRSGKGAQIWKQLKTELEKSTVEYRVYLTEAPGHARQLAASLSGTSAANDPDRIIVAVGGDGTLNEVVDGLNVSSHVTLGYIPTGSGNDFARSLKLPRKPARALRRILHPRYFRFLDYGILSCDVSNINHRRFVVSSGIGFDAAVCRRIDGSRLKRFLCRIHLSKLSYVILGIQSLFFMKTVSGSLVLDGIKKIPLRQTAFISTHIQKYEGGGFKFAPKADPCDGQFDICVISHTGSLGMIPALLLSFLGLHTRCKIVRIYRCHELSIHTDTPCTVHTDGEIMGLHSDISLSCRTRQLRVIV
ncbi:MAG: diacylglycerol kinase family lipid kinase [Lachnospiraceae bacterium]|jgi:YegS/Rv2252/BmrU family lipid kinase|nr:diacylglycerol kinase family lipid kinase [Lachnospiraceae bacterium]